MSCEHQSPLVVGIGCGGACVAVWGCASCSGRLGTWYGITTRFWHPVASVHFPTGWPPHPPYVVHVPSVPLPLQPAASRRTMTPAVLCARIFTSERLEEVPERLDRPGFERFVA